MIIYQSDFICLVCTEENESELHETYFVSGKLDREDFDRVSLDGIAEIYVGTKIHLSSQEDNIIYDCDFK